MGWRASSMEWWQTQRPRHDLFVSREVLRELSAESFPGHEPAMEMLADLEVLPLTAEVEELAQLLVREMVMPGPSISGDAVHVAAAAVHRMEYLLSWNVQHLANPNKRTHFGIICLRVGISAPIIVTPDMLWEPADE
jgi:hypothetical protein